MKTVQVGSDGRLKKCRAFSHCFSTIHITTDDDFAVETDVTTQTMGGVLLSDLMGKKDREKDVQPASQPAINTGSRN